MDGDPPDVSLPIIPAPHRNPLELDLALTSESVDNWKRSDCRFYLKCLDFAAEESWQQFHCNDCKAYVAVVTSSEERALAARLSMYFRGE